MWFGVCRDHDLDVVQIQPFAAKLVEDGVERVRDPDRCPVRGGTRLKRKRGLERTG